MLSSISRIPRISQWVALSGNLVLGMVGDLARQLLHLPYPSGTEDLHCSPSKTLATLSILGGNLLIRKGTLNFDGQ